MKKKFTIIADSSCDLRSIDLKDDLFDFVTIPISYELGGTDYQDNEDNDVGALVIQMKENKKAPKSACPSVAAFADVMRSAKTPHVFVVTLSSKISGTFNSARLASEEVMAEDSNKKIFVFDSLSTSAGLARIVFKLADLIKKNQLNFNQICEKLPEIRSHNFIRFLLNDLGNLVKSGRMSKVLGIVTSVIPIKLICGDNGEGEIRKYKQVLGHKKGIEALAEFPSDDRTESNELIVISHCNNEESASLLRTLLETKFGFKNIQILLMRGIAAFFANDKGIAIAY